MHDAISYDCRSMQDDEAAALCWLRAEGSDAYCEAHRVDWRAKYQVLERAWRNSLDVINEMVEDDECETYAEAFLTKLAESNRERDDANTNAVKSASEWDELHGALVDMETERDMYEAHCETVERERDDAMRARVAATFGSGDAVMVNNYAAGVDATKVRGHLACATVWWGEAVAARLYPEGATDDRAREGIAALVDGVSGPEGRTSDGT